MATCRTDFPSISKHARIGFEQRPRVVDEILETQERLNEVAAAAPDAALVWCVGNHDIRLASFVTEKAHELEGLWGTDLFHHFPAFQPCWTLVVNAKAALPVQFKHRMAGGITARARNIAKTGTHTVTSHTHFLGVTSAANFAGTIYGVDTGCVANVSQLHRMLDDRLEKRVRCVVPHRRRLAATGSCNRDQRERDPRRRVFRGRKLRV
jgi:hypothetical protein